MDFNPNNGVIKLCLQGIDLEEKGKPEEAGKIFLQAWNEAANDFEKFNAAHFTARHQRNAAGKLKWHETALQFALKIKNSSIKAAFPSLYSNIAECYKELGDLKNTKKYYDLAMLYTGKVFDSGPFYHGTKADLQAGELLVPGNRSNYKSEVLMNHIYFTALVNGAGLAAALAKGDGRERVYIIEPTGSFENDPNVTDKKFPGNPTRSYRSLAPLKITGEVTDWVKQTSGEVQKWREKLANNKKNIIN
jgi:rifampin ADP-ribosylating transferase